jgi:predicted DNA-binding WGR domain protein
MPLTAAQTTAFFENAAQMGIPHATVIQLQDEGISTVDDLADFDKDTIEQIAANLRRPAGRVPDPNPAAAVGATIPTPPFVFGAKSQMRLINSTNLLRYYDSVGRNTTAGNLQWTPVMKNFSEQWKALEDKKGGDEPEVPKITKALPIIKWTEAFRDYLHRVIGVRNIPLAYVIRPEAAVPPIGAQAAGAPHSNEHEAIETELIARAAHGHALFREDNSAVYYKLEEATRATSYAASIKPFQRAKNGRMAWLALSTQYAGNDKWEAEIKRHEQLLHTRLWKGQSNFTLERFIAQHRNAFVSMQAAAEHVTYQLPNEHSRVGYLLDAIQCNNAGLQAAMASIKQGQTADGMRNNFEAAATHLLPYDPVQKKRVDHAGGGKRGSADISDTTGEEANVSSFGTKKGTGSSGVSLRYHTKAEYDKLPADQKEELREWRKSSAFNKKGKGNKDGHRPSHQFDTTKAIASAVEKKVAEKMKAMEQEKTEETVTEAYIMSLFQKFATGKAGKVQIGDTTVAPATPSTATALTLKSIVKRAKNAQS